MSLRSKKTPAEKTPPRQRAVTSAVTPAVVPATKTPESPVDPAAEPEGEQEKGLHDHTIRYNDIPVFTPKEVGYHTAYDSLPEEMRDLSGKVFVAWTVIGDRPIFTIGNAVDKQGRKLRFDTWMCRCACEAGTTKTVGGNGLRLFKSQGCRSCMYERRIARGAAPWIRRKSGRKPRRKK